MIEILHLIVGYFGLGLLLTGGCVAGAFFVTAIVPPPWSLRLQMFFIVGAIVAAVATSVYGKGYIDGASEKQGEWDRAVSVQLKNDTEARSAAERDAARGVSDHRNRDGD